MGSAAIVRTFPSMSTALTTMTAALTTFPLSLIFSYRTSTQGTGYSSSSGLWRNSCTCLSGSLVMLLTRKALMSSMPVFLARLSIFLVDTPLSQASLMTSIRACSLALASGDEKGDVPTVAQLGDRHVQGSQAGVERTGAIPAAVCSPFGRLHHRLL